MVSDDPRASGLTSSVRLYRNTRKGFVPVHGKGRLHSMVSLTQDVLSFRLSLERPIEFLAGQFMALAFPGVQGFRAYSMTNHAMPCDELEFVVKAVPGGAVSNHLFNSERPENESDIVVNYFGPLGGAVFLPEEGRDVLAIAGGSGIAGMMSILEHATRCGYFEAHRGSLFFGVRTLAEAFFLPQLAELAARNRRLEVVIALSDETPPADEHRTGLIMEGGFVHEVAAAHMRGRFDGHTAYVAGPPPMVDRALRMLLVNGQFSAEQIRYDKFA